MIGFTVDTLAPPSTSGAPPGAVGAQYPTTAAFLRIGNERVAIGATLNITYDPLGINQDGVAYSQFAVTAVPAAPYGLINGRSLLFADFAIWDYYGRMFSGTDLPLDSTFASMASGGEITTIFHPNPNDPAFQQGGDIRYMTFLGDYSLAVTPVPEPPAWAMMLSGLGLLAVVTQRKRGVAIRATG